MGRIYGSCKKREGEEEKPNCRLESATDCHEHPLTSWLRPVHNRAATEVQTLFLEQKKSQRNSHRERKREEEETRGNARRARSKLDHLPQDAQVLCGKWIHTSHPTSVKKNFLLTLPFSRCGKRLRDSRRSPFSGWGWSSSGSALLVKSRYRTHFGWREEEVSERAGKSFSERRKNVNKILLSFISLGASLARISVNPRLGSRFSSFSGVASEVAPYFSACEHSGRRL